MIRVPWIKRKDDKKEKQPGPLRSAMTTLTAHTMDLILVVIFITLVIFTCVILWMFMRYEAIPDTLVTCVFTALASECGIMGWIKTAKEKTVRETAVAGVVDKAEDKVVSKNTPLSFAPGEGEGIGEHFDEGPPVETL